MLAFVFLCCVYVPFRRSRGVLLLNQTYTQHKPTLIKLHKSCNDTYKIEYNIKPLVHPSVPFHVPCYLSTFHQVINAIIASFAIRPGLQYMFYRFSPLSHIYMIECCFYSKLVLIVSFVFLMLFHFHK